MLKTAVMCLFLMGMSPTSGLPKGPPDLCGSHWCIHGACEVERLRDYDYKICICEPGYDGEFCERILSPKVAKPEILDTGICASSPQLPCCERTISIYNMLNENPEIPDLPFPVCRLDGYYAAKQCHPVRGCYCVDENGKESNLGKEDQPENHWDIKCAGDKKGPPPLTFTLSPPAPPGTDTDTCKDEDKNCGYWRDLGKCKGENEIYMSKICKKSCGTCGENGTWRK